MSITVEAQVQKKMVPIWTHSFARCNRIERTDTRIMLFEPNKTKPLVLSTKTSPREAARWANSMRKLRGLDEESLLGLPDDDSEEEEDSNEDSSEDEDKQYYQKPPPALANVRRDVVFKILLLHGAITTTRFCELASEDNKQIFKDAAEVEAFIEKHGPSWGLWIDKGHEGKVIRNQLTDQTIDDLEELPAIAHQRYKYCRDKIIEKLVECFEDLKQKWLGEEFAHMELSEDDAASAFLKWLYASLLRDEGYNNRNVKEDRHVEEIVKGPGRDRVLPSRWVTGLVEGSIKGRVKGADFSFLKAVAKKWKEETVLPTYKELKNYKLVAWLEALDRQDANEDRPEDEALDSSWTDKSLHVSYKEGPRPKLISLILSKRVQHRKELEETHRVVMGLDIYNKLKKKYNALKHDPCKMHSRMMVMLTIYDTLLVNTSTYGMQGTILPNAMKVLIREFDVEGECYASPVNRYNGPPDWKFCSAYKETDKWFGSEGSFYHFKPEQGSFECNPPFANDTVDHMFSHIFALLESSRKPLSFIVIIPMAQWNHAQKWYPAAKGGVPFYRGHQVLRQRDHMYLTGEWHKSSQVSSEDCWDAVMDTAVIWIQNDAGNQKWEPTADKMAKVAKAFRDDSFGGNDSAYLNL